MVLIGTTQKSKNMNTEHTNGERKSELEGTKKNYYETKLLLNNRNGAIKKCNHIIFFSSSDDSLFEEKRARVYMLYNE